MTYIRQNAGSPGGVGSREWERRVDESLHDLDGPDGRVVALEAGGGGGGVTPAQLADAIATRTALSVDGAFVGSYDLDSTPPAPSDLVPPAYTQEEVDDLLSTVGGSGGPWVPLQDAGAETNFTTTTWTPISGLAVTISVGSTSEVYRVDALVDLASYAANTATIIVNLTVDGSGTGVSFPLRFTDNGFRDSVPCSWIITGLSPGSHTLGLAAYLTASGNYQSGTGTVMIAERKA